MPPADHRPAHFVAFDLLQHTRGRVLLEQPLTRRCAFANASRAPEVAKMTISGAPSKT